MWNWIQQWGSPKVFYHKTANWYPWLLAISLVLISIAFFGGLAIVPEDYQQGNSFRIIYMHVPVASLSMTGYAVMAIAGAVGLIWKMKVADMVAKSCAPLGAWITLLALFTGSVWGKATWGAWWVWDARITSMVVLLFLYMGVLALHRINRDPQQGARAAAILGIVGVVNLVIVKYSVVWWNSLHQGSTFTITGESHMASEMVWPLLVSLLGMYLLCAALVIKRTRNEILLREQRTQWVKAELGLV